MPKNTTESEVRSSVSSIYADLLSKRKIKEESKKEQKRMEKELKEQKKAEEEADETKLTKKEKRQAEFDNWKSIVIGLTGDDIEYTNDKKSKKKYRKWIDDDDFNTAMLKSKQKKPKKKNYNKEFEPELNMLRTLVAEQNRFTADLQKRFQNAAGPATKDAQYPNKTLVELAAAISTGRSNSLGMLREIGNIKKTIADLYMKQKKLDSEVSGSGSFDNTDIGLMGSSIASSLFSNQTPMPNPGFDVPADNFAMQPQNNNITPFNQPSQTPVQNYQFDPATWEGPDLGNSYSAYESIPHTVVVEKNKESGDIRFVAIRDDNGEELVGCPVPTSDPKYLKINEDEMTVKGDFDEVYQLRYK